MTRGDCVGGGFERFKLNERLSGVGGDVSRLGWFVTEI